MASAKSFAGLKWRMGGTIRCRPSIMKKKLCVFLFYLIHTIIGSFNICTLTAIPIAFDAAAILKDMLTILIMDAHSGHKPGILELVL